MQNKHAVAESIAKKCGDLKMYVVWWNYVANYSDPKIELATSPVEAFENAFPFYKKTKNVEFHRFAVEILNSSKAVEIIDGKIFPMRQED